MSPPLAFTSVRTCCPATLSARTSISLSVILSTKMDASNETSSDEGGGPTKDFYSFCSSPFWDLDLTWNTTNPDFTPCFHQTVLTYIPALVILLGLPFQVSYKMVTYVKKIQLTPNLRLIHLFSTNIILFSSKHLVNRCHKTFIKTNKFIFP